MSSLVKLSASQMRAGLLSGEFTAKDLTSAHLDRIDATNTELNSFLLVTRESALESAENADKTIKQLGNKSPLFTGIPVAIKDMLVTKGIETKCASKILEGFIPPYDCTAVYRLKEHGAVILGKTNMDEFAMGSSNENSAYGPVRNPWDKSRVPGGSSGGSAACVCSGQAPIALGTDTGGSIRQPASLTGTIGLKPTYGRVSRYGAVAYASSLDQIGPFGRTVEDVAMALQVIAGKDSRDSTSIGAPVPNYLEELACAKGKGLSGLRVGVPKEYFSQGIDPEVSKSVHASIKALEGLGCQLVDISLPTTDYALATYYIIGPAEASSNLSRYDGIRYGKRSKNHKSLAELYASTRSEGFGQEVKRRILIGTYVLSQGYYDAYYRKAQQVRTLIIEDFKKAFSEQCDIIATPVSPTTAFALGEKTSNPLQMYMADICTIPVNLAGLPGISVPCGLDSKGLPIGLQLVGPALEETRLLVTAQAFMDQCPFDVTANIV